MRCFRNQILSAMGVKPAATVLIALALPGCGDDEDKGNDTGWGDVGDDWDGSSDADGSADDGSADADVDDDGSADDGSADADVDDDGSADDGSADADTDDDGSADDGSADADVDDDGSADDGSADADVDDDGSADDGSADADVDDDGSADDGSADADVDDDGSADADTDDDPPPPDDDVMSCEDVPDLTGSEWIPYTDPWPSTPFMVCQPLPDDGDWSTCPSMSEMSPLATTLLNDYFVDPDSAWGDPWAVVTCGPDETRTEACCYVMEDFDYMPWGEGRPFTVDGQARLAPTSAANGWSESSAWMATGMTEDQRDRLISHWTESAQFEHASVASFARFTMQLMAVGAPAELIAEATRAQADEIRHARVCLGIASTLADETIGLGALNIDGALEGADSVASILVDTIQEACVNETVSAAVCQAAGEAATDSFIAEALISIAEDEQRHSTLAWRTVRWLLTEHPELADLARTTFDEAMAQPWGSSTETTGELTPWGVLSRAQEQAVASRVMRRVIKPCADALLGTTSTVEATA